MPCSPDARDTRSSGGPPVFARASSPAGTRCGIRHARGRQAAGEFTVRLRADRRSVPAGRRTRQNRNFRPNCIWRGVLTVDRIVPKSGLPNSAFGRLKDGWFVRLNTSQRICSRRAGAKADVLRERSVDIEVPGPEQSVPPEIRRSGKYRRRSAVWRTPPDSATRQRSDAAPWDRPRGRVARRCCPG